jgi:acyl carrier protein
MTLADIVSSVAHPPVAAADVDDATPLHEGGLGVDSVGLLEIVVALEERFGVVVGAGDLHDGNFGTLARLVAFVARKLA